MGASCGCNKIKTGVYGTPSFNFDGLADSGLMVMSGFAGYVTAQKVDQTVTYLKDNIKTSGFVWTGASLAVNVLFPQMATNKMVQGASIGVGIYGLKQLNKAYDLLKGVNGLENSPNHANQYAARMAAAQAQARLQAQQAAQLPANMPPMHVAHNNGQRTVLQMRMAA